MKTPKEPFVFSSIVPCLDWYEEKKHTVNDGDFIYFKLDRRFGPSWWLYGMKTVEEPNYHWEETEIGEISSGDLIKFIEWSKSEYGNRIINIHMICGDFDIFKEVAKLSDSQLLMENEKLKRMNEKALIGLRGICKECKKYETCGNRKGSHFYCWEWKHSND